MLALSWPPLLAAQCILRSAQAWPAGVGSVGPPRLVTSKASSRSTPRARAKAVTSTALCPSQARQLPLAFLGHPAFIRLASINPPAFFCILWGLVCGDPCLPHPRPSHKSPCRPHSLSFLSIHLQAYQYLSTKPNNNPIPQI